MDGRTAPHTAANGYVPPRCAGNNVRRTEITVVKFPVLWCFSRQVYYFRMHAYKSKRRGCVFVSTLKCENIKDLESDPPRSRSNTEI